MNIFYEIGAVLQSNNFKISLGVFIFIIFSVILINNFSSKKKADRYISRIDEHRNFNKDDVIKDLSEQNSNQLIYNKYVKKYIRKNKDSYEKLLSAFAIDLKDIERKLTRANINSINAEQISIIRIGGTLLSLFVGVTLFLFLGVVGLIAGLVIAGICLMLPTLLIEEKYNARKTEILEVLPSELRLLADATSTGHTISDAIMRVTRKYDNLLSFEFKKAEEEARYSNDWILALENMSTRCDISEIYNLIAEVKITTEKGTSITDVLLNFADKIETERTLSLTEDARKKSTTLMLPILLFMFAPLLALILLPALDMVLNSI